MSVYEFVPMNAVSTEDKEDINPLELEFQTIVSCPLWVLGTEVHPLKEQ